MTVDADHKAKIRWHCRRGMLELDVLLLDFFEKHYAQLPREQQVIFERLLECPDQDLFNWLIGHEQPTDSGFAGMVERIRMSLH